MARKNKPEEVSIVPTALDSDTITDLQVLVNEQKIGEIHQEEDDRQVHITYADGRKGAVLSVEDAVQSLVAEYNLHK